MASMKKGNLFLGAAIVAAAIVAGLLVFRSEEPEPVAARSVGAPTATHDAPATPSAASQPAVLPLPPPAPSESVTDGGEDPSVIRFRVDAKGRIVTNEKARLDLEKLYALYGPAERQKKLEEVSQDLPPAAARQLAELLEQYKNYQEAQYQNFPPGREMVSPEQGLAEMDGMHALRVQYFGAEVTDGFFGEEEKIQRELLRLMA